MHYKVVITEDAEIDLDNFIRYLLFVKKSEQAAKNVLNDFEMTKTRLSVVAESLKECENTKLKDYKRINFMNHRYFILYRVEENQAVVYHVFHELQDCENQLY